MLLARDTGGRGSEADGFPCGLPLAGGGAGHSHPPPAPLSPLSVKLV